MDEIDRGKAGLLVFFLLVLGLGVGGFFLVQKELHHETKPKDSMTEETKKDDHKKDKSKEFIYFENENAISVEQGIIYKDVVINIDIPEAEKIAKELNAEMEVMSKSVKHLDEVTLEEGQELLYDVDNIFSADVRNYEIYEYKNYVSLVLYDDTYSALGTSGKKKPRAYVFDIKEGKLLSNTDVLNLYGKNTEHVIAAIKARLESTQQTITKDDASINLIKIDETVNNMKYNENTNIYIDQYGKLITNFVVNTNEVDYNDTIEIKGEN